MSTFSVPSNLSDAVMDDINYILAIILLRLVYVGLTVDFFLKLPDCQPGSYNITVF
jgi:hypothetical protein